MTRPAFLLVAILTATSLMITACQENRPPVAVITDIPGITGTIMGEIYEGETLVLDGSESWDPDGDALIYDWFQGVDYLGSQPQWIFTAPRMGTPDDLASRKRFVFTLRVTDSEGATAIDLITFDAILRPGPSYKFTRLGGQTEMLLCRDARLMGKQHVLLGYYSDWDGFNPRVYFDHHEAEGWITLLKDGRVIASQSRAARLEQAAWIRDCLEGRLRY